MDKSKAQGVASGDEVDPSEVKSPSEKLEKEAPEASPVPGAQNPESEEIKEEVNPNTE